MPDNQQTSEVIAEVRVHGNHVVTDDEVLKISGLTIGAPFASTTIAEVKKRLEDSKKFDTIEVLKRFASIEDPTRIVVVMIVNEGGVRIQLPALPGGEVKVVKRTWYRSLMYMPILDAEDGYGFTYGVRVAYPGIIGERSRLSFPLSWGGLKRAGAEIDRTFTRGPFSRIEVGGVIQQRTNPAFEIDDQRDRVWGRVERAIGPVRAGATGGWQRVTFDTIEDEYPSIAADIAFDTRLDPVLPRNAVFVSASIERNFFESRPETNRTRVDARGYVGLIGQSVAVLRVVREDANEPLPPYLQSLLGGWSSLRGFRAGAFVGDTMVNGSLEIRFPISSPLSIGKLGLSAFVDTGTTYPKGERFKDQPLYTGVGGSVWIAITALRMGLSVAHGQGSGTRVNFGGGLTF